MQEGPVSGSSSLERIGVGIDTARFGHRVSFLRPDKKPAAKPITVLENQSGYQYLNEYLEQLHQQNPLAHFHIHIDAAGQYSFNLEQFLRGLELPKTVSVGEPRRNKNYHKAHFPKSTSDDTESQAMARFGVVEQPPPTPAPTEQMVALREIASRLQAQVKQTTQAINRLHNHLARVFPELASLTSDVSARWVLQLLKDYPTAERIGRAHRSSLEKIPYFPEKLLDELQEAARQSVGAFQGPAAEALIKHLVAELQHSQYAEKQLRKLLITAFNQLPRSPHVQVVTIPGIGATTAAILVAKMGTIDRFATPAALVGYFGVFPDKETSGVDKQGCELRAGTWPMCRKGNDLVRAHLWNAARTAVIWNPAVRALYRRLRARGKRGDVALGHCMRKLLHLVFAVWKTDRPFDKNHFPWEGTPAKSTQATTDCTVNRDTAASNNEKTVDQKQDAPAKKVVTTATLTVKPTPSGVKSARKPAAKARPLVDFAFLREQVTMEQVLDHLGLSAQLKGHGQQRRSSCPVHGKAGDGERTFSVNLSKNNFQCFRPDCAIKGNALDLWAAVHGLPLYEAALHLAETFHLARNREEEPVAGPRAAKAQPGGRRASHSCRDAATQTGSPKRR
jgi:transposase